MNDSNLQLQEARTGAVPSDIEVYVAGHRGSNPSNSEQLCSQTASERLVRFLYFI